MLHIVPCRIRGEVGVLRSAVHANAAVGVSAPAERAARSDVRDDGTTDWHGGGTTHTRVQS
eukprot:502074-Prymnesium_polylepis.1